MVALLPTFFSSPKKKSSASNSASSSGGWQKSGPELKREGVRKKGALTSIHNISRKSSAGDHKDTRPVSSIMRAKNSESSAGGAHRHQGVSTEEEREADVRRYAHIRRLMKQKKKKEVKKEGKSKGLFF